MLVCRRCGREIAREEDRIEVLGAHEHTGANPGGFTYRIGCFAEARGVEVTSNPSSEWTWFPGYRWQVEACGGCGQQVGWRFVKHDHRFHGLVLAHLAARAYG